MPKGMWKQCHVPGCPGLTRQGKYCEKHAHLEDAERRERASRYNKTARDIGSQKLYDSAEWRKLREIHIRRNPLCESCLENGRITPAVIVDHKVEIKDGGGRLDPDNLQSLCRSCHNKKTAQERAKRKDTGDKVNG